MADSANLVTSMGYLKKRKTEGIRLDKIEMKLFGLGGATWVADDTERKAAWEMYVELITRITVEPLVTDQGLLREAMNSIYSLFGETRRILRSSGPNVARRKKESLSFAEIAVAVLNRGIRPFLTKWHARLKQFEDTPQGTRNEAAWPEANECRRELDTLRAALCAYADILAEAAGVDVIHRPEGGS
jgi:hypothetical protein